MSTSNRRLILIIFCSLFFVVTLGFYIPTFFIEYEWLRITGVTLLTTFFQVCIRPLTGLIVDSIYHNKMNYNNWWFKEKKGEKFFLKILLVKKWKNLMPTFDKNAFNFTRDNIENIIGATCQAEIVHELMFIESFLPLLLIIPYGTWIVFLVTSICTALFEVIFILIQRYNRPRLIRLLKLQSVNNLK